MCETRPVLFFRETKKTDLLRRLKAFVRATHIEGHHTAAARFINYALLPLLCLYGAREMSFRVGARFVWALELTSSFMPETHTSPSLLILPLPSTTLVTCAMIAAASDSASSSAAWSSSTADLCKYTQPVKTYSARLDAKNIHLPAVRACEARQLVP